MIPAMHRRLKVLPGEAQNFTYVSVEKQYTCHRQTAGCFIGVLLGERVEVNGGERETKRRRDRIVKVKTVEEGRGVGR